MRLQKGILITAVLLRLVPGVVPGARAQFLQQAKLVGSGSVASIGADPGVKQGAAVGLSNDGSTAIVGGPQDSNLVGAVWAFTRSNGAWSQQGTKLVGTGAVGTALQGASVALSGDGNTAIVGGPRDNGSAGAAWIFTRAGGVWSQQGTKLVGTGAVASGGDLPGVRQGSAVAISADGNTAIVGGPNDNFGAGAVWIFTRSGGVWTQVGAKLVGTAAVGLAEQGVSVALSGDGNTAVVGGRDDNSGVGAVWVFTQSGGVWTQQGGKLLAAGDVGSNPFFGSSVAASTDGNTIVVGAPNDNGSVGAVWVFTRTAGVWSQQGGKLVPGDEVGAGTAGTSVDLSGDGNTAIVGGPADQAPSGAVWIFRRTGVGWFQLGSNLTGAGAQGTAESLGTSVALSTDGSTAIAGGPFDGADVGLNPSALGAAWVFAQGAIAATSPVAAGPAFGSGSSQTMVFTFSDPRGFQDLDVVNVLINNFLDGRNSCYLAYSRTSAVLYLVNDPGTALLPGLVLNGSGSVSNSQCMVTGAGSSAVGSGNILTLTLNMSFGSGYAGNKVTYMAARDLQGNNSGWQALGVWAVPGATTFPSVTGVSPARGAGSSQTFTFTFSDTKGFADLGVVNILINTFLDGRQACYLAYSQPLNVLYLENDVGSGLLPGLALNGTGTLGNSQCTINGVSSSATGNGNTLLLTLSVTFGGTFTGNKVIYMAARDTTGANNSGWQSMGSWTVQ